MSDSSSPQSGQDPWGPPPPASQDPYGQSSNADQADPYGQSSGYGRTNPYGHSDPYGQSSAYGSTEGQDYPPRRPGTVVAAGMITLVCSGLVGLLAALLTIALLIARGEVVTEIDRALNSEPGAQGVSAATIANGALVSMVVLLVWCVAACVLGALVMQGKGWARVMLVISSAITAVVSLLAILSLFTAVSMIAAIAVIILLFTGGANPWFAHQRSTRQKATAR